MEYYQIKLKHNNEKIGIGYDPKNGILFVGGFTRILRHITPVVVNHFRIKEEDLLAKTGVKKKNYYRYYAKISDTDFRAGLRRAGVRRPLLICKEGIFKFA